MKKQYQHQFKSNPQKEKLTKYAGTTRKPLVNTISLSTTQFPKANSPDLLASFFTDSQEANVRKMMWAAGSVSQDSKDTKLPQLDFITESALK